MSVAYDKVYISVTMLLLYASFAFEFHEIILLQERSREQGGITWATFYNSVTAQCRKLPAHTITDELFSVYSR